MLKRFLFGSLFGMAVLALLVFISGGSPILFWDFASVMLVIFLPFASGFISHGPKAMAASFKLAFGNDGPAAGIVELKKAKACIQALGRYVSTTAVLGVFLGIIIILRDVSDLNRVGRNMAVCLISVMYTAILHIFFTQPLAARLEDRIIARENA
jgi:flagellar motor component MotA